MRHARSDYNRFKDPAEVCQRYGLPVGRWIIESGLLISPNKVRYHLDLDIRSAVAELLSCDPNTIGIKRDEPVFIIRAQDRSGPDAVRDWAKRAEQHGAASDIVERARMWALTMEEWQEAHMDAVKAPDMPPCNK